MFSIWRAKSHCQLDFKTEVRGATETDSLFSMADREVAFSRESLADEQLTSLPENMERLSIWALNRIRYFDRR